MQQWLVGSHIKMTLSPFHIALAQLDWMAISRDPVAAIHPNSSLCINEDYRASH
jgi:hypothetical protein